MTQLEIAYRYDGIRSEKTMRALSGMREVYGVRKITFDEKVRVVRVEFDASRLKEPVIERLLRETGLDISERLTLA